VKRPNVNTRLRLLVDGFADELYSRVEDLFPEGTIVIANPSAAGVEISLAAGQELQLEWAIKRGVARQRAVVQRHVNVGVPGLVLEPLDEPLGMQRRNFVRVDAILPVVFEPEDGPPVRGTTLDLSGGGMRGQVTSPLPDGSAVRVTIDLPTGESIGCVASTIRCIEGDVYAFEFAEIGGADRERLIRFVFAYQRERLQEGRLTA
jgi:c-di-GMP-binding flagellar brake protein YcgR